MKLSAALVLTTLAAAQAASLPGLLTNLRSRELSARQDVPAVCVRSCQPVASLMSNGCPPASCCTSTFTQSYVACYVCVATQEGRTDYSEGEATMTALVEACRAQGFVVEPVPFPRPNTGSTTGITTSSVTVPTPTGTVSITSTTSATTPQVTITTVPSTTATTPTITRSTVTSVDTSLPTTSAGTTGGNGAVGLGGGTPWLLSVLAAGLGMMLV